VTTREQLLEVLRRLPDDLSIDRLIAELHLLESIRVGLQQADAGDVIDHDEFKRQLPEIARGLASRGGQRSARRQLAGMLNDDDAREMKAAIEVGCERIDSRSR
jgi:hypothetical protein